MTEPLTAEERRALIELAGAEADRRDAEAAYHRRAQGGDPTRVRFVGHGRAADIYERAAALLRSAAAKLRTGGEGDG
jgi:hypothetical protein